MKEKITRFFKTPYVLLNLFFIFVAIFCLLAGFNLITVLFKRNVMNAMLMVFVILLLLMFVVFVIRKLPLEKRWVEVVTIIFILAFSLIIRISANAVLKTVPFSDFQTPNIVYQADKAEVFAPHDNSGENSFLQRYYSLYPSWYPYMMVVSSGYDMFGYNDTNVKVMNWTLGMVTMLFLYLSVKEVFDKKTGVLAILLFACFPSLILYSSIQTPDHITICLFALWIFTWVKMIKYRFLGSKRRYLIGFCHILVVALINYFKPLSIFGILVFLCLELLFYLFPIIFHKEKRKEYVKESLVFVGFFLVVSLLVSMVTQKLLKMEIEKTIHVEVVDSTPLYLLWAYSLNENKHYDPNVATDVFSSLQVKHNYDQKKVMEEIKVLAKEQFIRNLPYLPQILFEKFKVIFTDESDIFGFSNYSGDATYQGRVQNTYYSAYYYVASAFLSMLLLLTAWSLMKASFTKEKNPMQAVVALMLIGYFMILLLGGVQSRYKMLISAPLCFLAATGIVIKPKKTKENIVITSKKSIKHDTIK